MKQIKSLGILSRRQEALLTPDLIEEMNEKIFSLESRIAYLQESLEFLLNQRQQSEDL